MKEAHQARGLTRSSTTFTSGHTRNPPVLLGSRLTSYTASLSSLNPLFNSQVGNFAPCQL
jgi:hypothetical protein